MTEKKSEFAIKREAKKRFFIQGAGIGNGIRFYDVVSDINGLTVYNVYEWMVELRDTSRIIHKHLLDTPVDNVVELNSMLRVM